MYHSWNGHTHGYFEIRREIVKEFFRYLLGHFELRILQGIDPDDGDDLARHPLRRDEPDRPGHRVADENDPREA